MVACKEIGEGARAAPELLGSERNGGRVDSIRAESAYDIPLSGARVAPAVRPAHRRRGAPTTIATTGSVAFATARPRVVSTTRRLVSAATLF